MIEGERFLACRHVVRMVGLSKSEIYRQIEAGHFPRSRAYPNNPHRRFWLHSEVEAWMLVALAQSDDFDSLLR